MNKDTQKGLTKKYYSGYIDCDRKSDYSKRHYKGKFFSIYFGASRKGKSNVTYGIQDIKGNSIEKECREAIIKTNSLDNAIKVLDLISSALTLLKAELYEANILSIDPLSTEDRKLISQKLLLEEEMVGSRLYCIESQLLLACQIACKASFKMDYCNALLKYQLGNSICPIDEIDVSPFHSPYYRLSRFKFDCARFAYAIIAFYSVIEELGLEIRASEKKPSFINGEWNPKVREDLENRLTEAGIDPSEVVTWNLRSTPTRIERYLRENGKLRPIKKTSWARANVRDTEIELIDAIALVSNLRSSISSHKFNKSVESLSIYDVSNANYLARRLLLGAIGLWKPKGK